MKRDPDFLTVEHVLTIHARMIKEFGGRPEVRDRGLLESAVSMPQSKFGGQFLHTTIPAMAAAYLFHLCKNHPFVDGNKRTALTTAEIFIRVNHYKFTADDPEAERITTGVADGTISKEELTQLFKKLVKRS